MKMKTDAVEFDTRKKLDEIVNILQSFDCSIQGLNSNAFGGQQADIEVLMEGLATMADAMKNAGAGKSHWGVQVIVYDMGKYRHVELIALGEKAGFQGYGRSALDVAINGLDYINIRHSKMYRDRIKEKLDPVETVRSSADSDANTSKLYRAMKKLPDPETDDLINLIYGPMAECIERFLINHPDFSRADLLSAECSRLYRVAGKVEKANSIAGKGMGIDLSNLVADMNEAMPELLQFAEDDAIVSNDRTALYIALFYLIVNGNDSMVIDFLCNNLLDRVIRIENAGGDVSEDMKIWPVMARIADFENWHLTKHGQNGKSGAFDPSDPVAMTATGIVPVIKQAEPVPTTSAPEASAEGNTMTKPAAYGGTGSTKVASAGGAGHTFEKKYLIIAAAFIAAIVLTAVIVSSLNKAKYEEQYAIESEEDYYDENEEYIDDEYSDDDYSGEYPAFNSPGYHTFYFDTAGGDGEFQPIENVEYNYTFELPLDKPVKDDNVFLGWYVERLSDGKYYSRDVYGWIEWDGYNEDGYTPNLYEPGTSLLYDDSWEKTGGSDDANFVFHAVWEN